MALTIRSFELGDFATNAYVVWQEDGPPDACWVIDCPYEPEPMLDFIESKGLKPSLCILTHCHCDHVAGLARMRLRLGPVNTLCHIEEKAFNEDPILNLSAFIPPSVTAPPPDACLKGGELLELGGHFFRILHTPGHSPGGITIWCEELGLAFDGDTLFAGSIGRLDFPTSEPADMRTSLELLMQLPDATRLLPGHGPETTVGAERRSNPYLRPGAF